MLKVMRNTSKTFGHGAQCKRIYYVLNILASQLLLQLMLLLYMPYAGH